MEFADIHIHVLCGVDDGVKTEADMYAMVDAAYADGTRVMCATPHFHLGYFGDNVQKSVAAFDKLSAYVSQKYPKMRLYLGNELRYSRDCVSWLDSGQCRTLNGSRFLLVDFSEWEEEREIVRGLEKLLNAGYLPVLAHAERYQNFGRDKAALHDFRANGVLLQIDAQSLTGGFGLNTRHRSRRLLADRLADVISSDAHNLSERPPGMSNCFAYIAKRYGEDYARALCVENGKEILEGSVAGKD